MPAVKKGFQGNNKIRAAGVPVDFTPENLQEFAKCMTDARYFIETYVKIRVVDSETLVNFKPRPYQLKMLDYMVNERKVISCWPRQCGKSLIVASTLLWFAIFHENFNILIAANKGSKARDILIQICRMYEELPEWLTHGVKEWNKGNIVLANGSQIRATATSGSSGRGDTVNLIYIDEAAFIQSHVADEFFRAVVPTISSGTTSKIFITSTPKGMNFFHKMWRAAVAGESGYSWVEIKWNDVPGRDEKFKAQVIAEFGEHYWLEEYAAEFLGSTNTLITGSKLSSLITEKPLISQPHYHIYEHPDPSKVYAVTVDVAEGLGGDYSVLTVFDITALPYRVVAIYRNNQIAPMAYPAVIHDFCLRYNKAIVLVEANFGQQIADILWTDLQYENVIMTARSAKKGDHVSGGFASNARPGLQMTVLSKRIGCTNLKTLVEQDQLIISDSWIYDEMCRFVVKGKSYAADDGNDDTMMTLVMFAWLVDQGYVKESTNQDIRRKIAEMNAKAIEDDMVPLGGICLGEDDVEHISFAGERDGRDVAMDRLGAFFSNY